MVTEAIFLPVSPFTGGRNLAFEKVLLRPPEIDHQVEVIGKVALENAASNVTRNLVLKGCEQALAAESLHCSSALA